MKAFTLRDTLPMGIAECLKVTKTRMEFLSLSENGWFFTKHIADDPLFTQDTVHIGTKLKTVFKRRCYFATG